MLQPLRGWLAGLTIGLAGIGLPRAAVAQPASLEVSATSPNGPAQASVTQASIRFSEPMVPLTGTEVDDVGYVHVTPAMPVRFRWADSNVLVVSPASGRFPHATVVTISIDAGVTAVSGRRLDAPVRFTFETPAPRLQAAYAMDLGGVTPPTQLDLTFDQSVRADDAASRLVVTLESDGKPLPTLTDRARAYLARVDPAALAAHDAWLRRLRAAIGSARPLSFTVAHGPVSDTMLRVTLAEPPPEGARMVVRATGVGSPEGPLRRETPDRQEIATRAPFAVLERDCAGAGACEPAAVAMQPTRRVDPEALRAALRVVDITRPSRPQAVTPGPQRSGDWTSGLQALGFTLVPGRRYAIRLDPGLASASGETLPAPWCSIVDVGLPGSFVTFGTGGHAVWEAGLGPRLPLLTRSVVNVRGGAVAIAPERIVPALVAGAALGNWRAAPRVPQTITRVPGRADGSVREVFVSVASALSTAGTGVLWAAFPSVLEAPGASSAVTVRPVPYVASTLIQVTNIGVTVRGSADRLALLASRLDAGAPIAAAAVTLLDRRNTTLWRGRTDPAGLAVVRRGDWIARGDGAPFAAVVEHGGDTAFVLVPYSYDRPGGIAPLTGVLFTDRGVYRPGESVRVRAFVQEPRPEGLRLFPAGTPVTLRLEHEGDDMASYETTLDAVGGAEWTVPIPVGASTDDPYRLVLRHTRAKDGDAEIECPLPIKAFRPAEFTVGVTATIAIAEGRPEIDAVVEAHDLSEVPLAGAPVEWKITRDTLRSLPDALARDPDFAYTPYDVATEEDFWQRRKPPVRIDGAGTIDTAGRQVIGAPLPDGFAGRGRFTVAALVRDASSQVIGRDVTVDVPADVYLGVAADPSQLAGGAAILVVARTPAGEPVAGLDVDIRVERKRGPHLELHATTAPTPVRVVVPDAQPHQTVTVTARGARQVVMPVIVPVAFEAPKPAPADAEPLTLSLDQAAYRPGATARLRIESGWRDATALVTLERQAILHAEAVRIVNGLAIVELPVGASPTSGLVAAVTLVRGRIAPCCDDPKDPGRPMSASATVDVPIDRRGAALAVAIEVPAGFQAPGSRPRVRVRVRDDAGRPAAGRVTLWAVDEGVLALTAYDLPQPDRMYEIEPGWLQTEDTRRLILGHVVPDVPWGMLQTSTSAQMRTLAGPPAVGDSPVRQDLRPLAFWFGALDTDADGAAEVDATLPGTLTTYRVMAIAADTTGRYGAASAPLVVAKRLMARPALPRVLTRADCPRLRATIASRDLTGNGTVRIESLTPDLLAIDAGPQGITVSPTARAVAEVPAVARAAGLARIRVTAAVGGAYDVVEREVPIVEATLPETSAAFGETRERPAIEAVRLPDGIDATAGGLDLEVSSTLLVGLAASGRYIRDYPYRCVEQTATRALALLLAQDLGPAFAAALGARDEGELKAQAQVAVDALEAYRCGGRYAYWAGNCRLTSPAVTTYVLHVLETAARRGLRVDPAERTAVADAVTELVMQPLPVARTHADNPAWRAFAVKVLVDAGRRPVRAIDAIYGVRRDLPVFAIAHLMDAIHVVDPASPRLAELRRLIANATTPAGATAHIQERSAPEYAWLWPSPDKSTGIVLDALARTRALTLEEARPLVAGLMGRRRSGIWAGTQGNVWVLAGLASYRRTFEATATPVTATATLGSTRLLHESLTVTEPARTRPLPMAELRAIVPPGTQAQLAIASSGPGPVFYATRLAWRRGAHGAPALDHGMVVTRRYERLVDGTPQGEATTFAASDAVRVTITVRVPQDRTFVAVTDPLPGGFEAVDATLAGAGHDAQASNGGDADWGYWTSGFDHLQRYDDRVDLFATSLRAGTHTVSYVVRATTRGTFFAAPTRAEAMYEPEVAGRGEGATIVVGPAR